MKKLRFQKNPPLILLLLLLFALPLSACYSSQPTSPRGETQLFGPQSIRKLASGEEKPPSPEETRRQLDLAGRRWLYGHGLGQTMVNVGAVLVFPPYGLYLLGNAGIALAGYEPLYVTDALPEKPKEYWQSTFNGVTSVPGRCAAAVAGEDFIAE